MSCPYCGWKEVDAMSPRTVYECGSSDYDQRPGTYLQSERCVANVEIIDAMKDALSGWNYIRDSHGELYGVGFDRVQNKLEKSLRHFKG